MASLFAFATPNTPKPKTHISLGTLPPYVDPTQLPTKKSPWRQIREMPFIRSVSITLPISFYNKLWPPSSTSINNNHTDPTAQTQTRGPPQSQIENHSQTQLESNDLPSLRYSHVRLSLTTILSPPFLNHYLKTPGVNIQLLSPGTPGVSDYVIHIYQGNLHVEMSREVYERVGIQGRPTDRNGGGQKHRKDRWTIELDLRAPSMVQGKKKFEKLTRAAKEVLGKEMTWSFRDCSGGSGVGSSLKKSTDKDESFKSLDEILALCSPDPTKRTPPVSTVYTVDAERHTVNDVIVPQFLSSPAEFPPLLPPETPTFDSTTKLAEHYHDLLEYLDLLRLRSPRIRSSDKVDPYISRYSVPSSSLPPGSSTTESQTTTTTMTDEVMTLTWQGLIDPQWCMGFLVDILRRSRRMSGQNLSRSGRRKRKREPEQTQDELVGGSWLVLSINAHRTQALGQVDGCVVLLRPECIDGVDTDGGSGAGGGDVMEEVTEEMEQREQQQGRRGGGGGGGGGGRGGEEGERDDGGSEEDTGEINEGVSQRGGGGRRGGLERFICFQLVDTVTVS